MITFFCGLFPIIVLALSRSDKSPHTTQNIAVEMHVSGDINGDYSFAGQMGGDINAEALQLDPACLFKALFRKLKYRNKNSVEVWLTLECTFKEQNIEKKYTYKPHRIYLEIKEAPQKIRLPILAENLKNVHLEFSNLSLKVGK